MDLPPEKGADGKYAKLLYIPYGMRTAANGWEREYSGILEVGCVVGRVNAVIFFHPERDGRASRKT